MPGFRIFVGRVPLHVTTDEVKARFSQFGKILDAYIPHNPITRQSKGMAFVSFDTTEAVEQVLAHGKHLLGGELCEVKRADPKSDSTTALVPVGLGLGVVAVHPASASEYRVFVKGIPDNLADELIRAHFETFGIVNDVYLPVQYGCTDGSRRRGIGYITFATEQSLAECLASPQQNIQGIEVSVTRADNNRSGKRLDDVRGAFAGNFPGGLYGGASAGTVGFPRFRPEFGSPYGGGPELRALPAPDSRPRPDYGSTGPSGPQFAPRRVFVGRIPKDMEQTEVGDHFTQHCGEITDIYFPKDPRTGTHRGFCYITFAEEAGVHRALTAPREIGGVTIGEVRLAEARAGEGSGGPPPAGGGGAGYGGSLYGGGYGPGRGAAGSASFQGGFGGGAPAPAPAFGNGAYGNGAGAYGPTPAGQGYDRPAPGAYGNGFGADPYGGYGAVLPYGSAPGPAPGGPQGAAGYGAPFGDPGVLQQPGAQHLLLGGLDPAAAAAGAPGGYGGGYGSIGGPAPMRAHEGFGGGLPGGGRYRPY